MSYKSIDFVKKQDGIETAMNTWTAWHLIPSSRPVIVQPSINYKYIDIPGKSGQLDLTDYLAGKPTYTDRKGSWEFYVVHDHFAYRPIGNSNYNERWQTSWQALRIALASFFDGSRMSVHLEDMSNAEWYKGRVFFNSWKSDKDFSKVVIEYQLDPYYYNGPGDTAKEVGL